MARNDGPGSPQGFSPIDAVLPKEMAWRAESAGVDKTEQDTLRLLALAVMAGSFIALGAVFAAAVIAVGGEIHSSGPVVVLGGMAFSMAFVLIVVGGAELFTSNNLMVMAWASGRLSITRLLRAWAWVYIGNFVGAVSTGVLLLLAGVPFTDGGDVGAALVSKAVSYGDHSLSEAFVLGLLGNVLVCMAIWQTYSARTTTDRILVILLPVTAFYILGLAHAIAIMFYLPMAGMIEWWAAVTEVRGAVELESGFEVGRFLSLLLAVTAGNIVGGGVLVGLMYWFIYLHPYRSSRGN